jgi:hypothetical protein
MLMILYVEGATDTNTALWKAITVGVRCDPRTREVSSEEKDEKWPLVNQPLLRTKLRV